LLLGVVERECTRTEWSGVWVFAEIDDPDNPEVLRSAQFTSYTWHYLPSKGSTQGQPQWIALTFDLNGLLVAVDAP
jgi:hypothetical protein